jgi:hypothetical protein
MIDNDIINRKTPDASNKFQTYKHNNGLSKKQHSKLQLQDTFVPPPLIKTIQRIVSVYFSMTSLIIASVRQILYLLLKNQCWYTYNNTDRLWYKRDINRYYEYLVCSIYNTEDNHHEIINQYKKTNKIKQETKTSNNQHEHTRKTKDEKHETN